MWPRGSAQKLVGYHSVHTDSNEFRKVMSCYDNYWFSSSDLSRNARAPIIACDRTINQSCCIYFALWLNEMCWKWWWWPKRKAEQPNWHVSGLDTILIHPNSTFMNRDGYVNSIEELVKVSHQVSRCLGRAAHHRVVAWVMAGEVIHLLLRICGRRHRLRVGGELYVRNDPERFS